MSKQIKGVVLENLDKLIGEKFGNYSKYIIQERALPDVRDGLKPVQRRILFSMSDLKLTHKSAYKKSARVVGDVIGKYHPHGDSSVYEAMVRLGQDWKVNMPLVDMHGNKGSIDGDSPAAMRYTETRLARITDHLLSDLDKGLVDFAPNFDDSEKEPVVLPARYPNVLVNGASGIAAGYSTNIPPHNLKEIIKALVYILNNESYTLSDLTKYVKGPDFPTGGSASTTKSIREAYKTGKGKVVLRAKIDYDQKSNELRITEIPYETNKSDLVRKIDDMIRNSKIPGVKEIRDDTDRTGMLITVKLSPDTDAELVKNVLYKKTDLQKNYNINMVAIKGAKPELLGLVDILGEFASFQETIYSNLYRYEAKKIVDRVEIVDGLIKVVSIIDEIIKIIRNSKNKAEAKANIISKYDFTDRQAEAIVNLRLYRLTSTDVNQLTDEKKELEGLRKHFEKGLTDKKYLREQIVLELEKFSEEFGIKRRTVIEGELEEIVIDETDLIKEEEVVVVVTHQGYIKRVSTRSMDSSEFDTLGRRDSDVVLTISNTSSTDNVVLFSSNGKYYTIPVYKLKEYKWKDVGDHVSQYTGMDGLDRIVSIAFTKEFEYTGNIVAATKNGLVKQTNIANLSTTTKRGSKYMNVKAGDAVASIQITNTQDAYITSIMRSGLVLKYELSNVPIIGLATAGVKNVNLNAEDEVVSIIVSPKADVDSGKTQLLFVTNNGKGKRIKLSEIKTTSRGSKGSQAAKQVKSNPYKIINAFDADVIDNVNILTENEDYITIPPKSDIQLSDAGTGLSKLTKTGITQAYADLELSLGEQGKPKVVEKTEKEIDRQLNLESILDEF